MHGFLLQPWNSPLPHTSHRCHCGVSRILESISISKGILNAKFRQIFCRCREKRCKNVVNIHGCPELNHRAKEAGSQSPKGGGNLVDSSGLEASSLGKQRLEFHLLQGFWCFWDASWSTGGPSQVLSETFHMSLSCFRLCIWIKYDNLNQAERYCSFSPSFNLFCFSAIAVKMLKGAKKEIQRFIKT